MESWDRAGITVLTMLLDDDETGMETLIWELGGIGGT